MTYTDSTPYDCFVSDSFQAFEEAAKDLAMKERRIVLIAEKHYSAFYSNDLSDIFRAAGKSFDLYEIIGEVKDFAEEAEKLAKAVEPVGLTTDDCIVALGGHVADAVTRIFASRYFEGIKYVFLPVTLTSQVLPFAENEPILEINTKDVPAYAPSLVYINLFAFKYLSQDERLSGMGEILRRSVADNRSMLVYLEENIGRKPESFSEFLLNLIMNCITTNKHLAAKKKPAEASAIYGYTLARGLEKCTNYIIPHGQAAGIGMVVANSIAAKRGLLKDDENFRIAKMMVTNGLSVSMNFTDELIEAICAAVESDGIVSENGTLQQFVTIDKPGHTLILNDVTMDEIKDVMNYKKF